MRLSIIVPVYNVDLYLTKCLSSLVHQNIDTSEFEILVLNDGSTDNSQAVIKQFSIKYTNVRIFQHPNRGLSGTRNRGLKEAKGDYVWFVDSDDWIEDNCLKEIVQALESNPDVLSFSGMIPEGNRHGHAHFYSKDVDSLEKLFFHGMPDPVQFYIYNRNYLLANNFFFKEGIKHEDTLFTPITLYSVSKIVFYRTAVYHLLYREGSITTTQDIKRVKDLSETIQELYSFSNKIENTKIFNGFQNKLAHRITEMLNYAIENGFEGEKMILQIMETHPEYWSVMKNANDFKPRVIYKIIRLSPLSLVCTYRILVKVKMVLEALHKIKKF